MWVGGSKNADHAWKDQSETILHTREHLILDGHLNASY